MTFMYASISLSNYSCGSNENIKTPVSCKFNAMMHPLSYILVID